MVKHTDNPPTVVSSVNSRWRSHFDRLFSKVTTWAGTPQGLSLILQGKMALKMAIASAISLVISQSLQSHYPFYAVIAAIIVMSSTHGSTLKLGIQRLIGTVIGAIAGAAFTVILGSNFWSLGICVFITIFLASHWKYHEAAKLAGYVSAIVILSYNHSPWLYAWHRFLDTLLGISVAVLVNNLIFPARAGKELRRCLSQTLINLQQLYSLVVHCAFTGIYDRPAANELKANIITSLRTGKELWQEVRHGQTSEPPETRINQAWEFLMRRIWEHILAMEHTVLARHQDTFWQMLSPQISELAQETQNAMLTLAIAVKSTHSQISLPEIEIALAHATRELNQLQATKQTDDKMDELLRFFTFFYTMEEVGRKLQRMAALLSD
ncbi:MULTISPECIES: aromatic acid exporter family protein [unclassified Anabaena]|uniref:FUSC family protein n=1 Tax=unclassified Anabaena TaxID=2619674 RepID=UPI0008372B9B|nr:MULTISPECIES: aromatic acid exporter family protein [unclassified Anabaena]